MKTCREILKGSLGMGLGFILICICYILFFPSLTIGSSVVEKRLLSSAPGDCSVCHNKGRVLPINHVDTKALIFSKCEICHEKTKKVLKGKIPLSHIHLLNGVGCGDCHEDPGLPKALDTEKCLSCHGRFEDVAEETKNCNPSPHNSPHYGMELDCDLCHHQHRKSENYCTQCHEWKTTVP